MNEPTSPSRADDAPRASERGMTTAEYALGTIAAVTGAGVLITMVVDPTMPTRVFWPLLKVVLAAVLRLFGVAG